jgi:hypothetical protein
MKRIILCLTALAMMLGHVYQTEAIPITSGLAGYWPGNDDTADDQSGNNNDGTLNNGATFAAGVVGKGFSFDGVDDFISVPTDPSLNLTSTLTIAGWVNYNDPSLPILSKRDTSNRGYQLAISGNGKLLATAFGFFDHFSSITILTGSFVHVAWTYDRFQGQSKLYINGTLDTTLSRSDSIATTSFPLLIGAVELIGGGKNLGGGGLVDEAAIYNRALVGSEIQTLASVPEPSALILFLTGLLSVSGYGYWRRKKKA